jgi:YVTN family beta-propeller protein
LKRFGWKLMLFITVVLLGSCSTKTIQKERAKEIIRDYSLNSNNIAINKRNTYIYTANLDVHTVTIYNVEKQKVDAEIPVGKEPSQLVLSPDEKYLYVSCLYDHQVDIISLERKKVVDSIQTGIEPYGVMTSQDGKKLFVSNFRSGNLQVFNLKDKKLVKEVPLGDRPRSITITSKGDKLYIPLYLEAKICVVDLKNYDVVKTIQLQNSPDLLDRKKSQGIPNTLEQLVIAPDGKTAWIPHLLTNVDTPIHFQETIFPAVSVIDTVNDQELIEQRKELFEEMNVLDSKNETMIVSNPYDVAFSKDGSKAYVVMSGSEDLVVFDLKRGGNATQILRRMKGNNPRGIVVNDEGTTAYVHNAMSHDLSIIDLGGSSPYARVKQTTEPISLIKKDPLSELVREGKTIFYSANSDEFATDITGNNWMSCASCHSNGEINGLTLMTPKGQRNVPSNVLTTKTGLFMWDGSRDDFTDYIHTVQGEMGGMMDFDPSAPLPPEVKHMYDAMFAFLDQPDSFPVPKSPYRNDDGSLSNKAKAGELLFNGKGNCLSCHGGEFLTDSTLAVNAEGALTTDRVEFLHNIGTANKWDQDSDGDARGAYKNPRKKGSYDTPTLRGVWATAPYLHDGSAKTIEEAIIKHKNNSIPTLSDEEIQSIAEYVRSLE